MWAEKSWSSLTHHQKADLCHRLYGGDEREARAAWSELRRRYPLLCGGMPPKPWVKTLADWCYTVSGTDPRFCPVAFRWDCPPPGDVQLCGIVTLRFVAEYTYPVARGFKVAVGGLVETMMSGDVL